jgi:transglutaminase-like putative cysteine protease
VAFDRDRYLQPSLLCDFDRSPAIRKKALALTGGCRNRRQKFEKVCAFVKELPYGLEDWDVKASQTLNKGWGMCSGKTNLLVAMLRSIGIPARYRIYQLKANMEVWRQAGREMGRQGIAEELGEIRDHVDCEALLGKWVDFDPGRDTAMEKGMLSLGMPLERNKVTDAQGKVIYRSLAVFDEWARERQRRRKFRSGRTDIFADINRGFEKLRQVGKITSH